MAATDLSAPETTFVAEPGSHAATTTAVIAAPIENVWRAHVEPDLFVQWWGPAELTSRVETWEPTSGGSWRVVHIDPEGGEYGFRGVYHEVVPQERLIFTFEFEGMPGHVCLETHTFEAVEGGTRVTQHAVFQSVEDRDGMAESGMEAHAPVAMAQLQAVASSL
ncbi:SRPBCC family protein [Actinomarinicola tropica]|uniref:ATPase n=1 Tax=Actinomarinicola tropica TaxID=2789776 RepID=A0A5Q2RFX1_9ACTN|nr:SRPBCC family protein [Actinomarinicola tropica]QGG94544.1 ATPase [Actinomarinicola tropica]